MTYSDFKSNTGRLLNKYIFLFMSFFTFTYALFMPDRAGMGSGYYSIVTSPSYLTHDFFAVGGFAATFMNVSLHFLLAYFIISHFSKSTLNGLQIASVGFYCGHAFFGSHILNILPPILGVYLYAKWARQPFLNYGPMAIFSNSLGPIVSIIWTITEFSISGIFAGVTIGIVSGFISVPLAERTISFHNGLTLLNFGFTAGIIGIVFNTIISAFNETIPAVTLLHEDATLYSLLYLLLFIIILALISLFDILSIRENYPALLRETGRAPSDFPSKFGYSSVITNMAIMGSVCVLIILLLDFPMNGTTIGAIFCVIAFSAFGVHPFNTLPVFLGVILGGLVTRHPLNSQFVVLPLFFGMGLAPVAGNHGIMAGILAGFLHYAFVSRGLLMHAGSILYNNGFSTGFIAVFLSPILNSFKRPKQGHLGKKRG